MLTNSNSSQSCNFEVKINDFETKHTTSLAVAPTSILGCMYCNLYINQYLSWTVHIHNLEMKLS